MGVKFILNQAGSKMGLSPSAASSRAVLLRFLNEAADELYNQSDPPNSLWEQCFKVNGDQTISCPWYVGQIRGVREMDSQITWSINRMRPRYYQFNWPDSWRNLRLKNTQALMATVINQSKGIIVVPIVETPPVVVSVSGPTLIASSVTENIVMDALSKSTVNNYLDYTSVKKDRVNDCDVTLNDVDGRLMTMIPANMLEAKYQIIDVSQCPWLAQSTSSLDHYLEIYYKWTLTQLVNDNDEYLNTSLYDNILVNKMMQLWYEEQGKPDLASAYDSKATRSLARKTEDQNRATEDVIGTVANPHDVILPRVRAGRRRYYRGYGSRGYGF